MGAGRVAISIFSKTATPVPPHTLNLLLIHTALPTIITKALLSTVTRTMPETRMIPRTLTFLLSRPTASPLPPTPLTSMSPSKRVQVFDGVEVSEGESVSPVGESLCGDESLVVWEFDDIWNVAVVH